MTRRWSVLPAFPLAIVALCAPLAARADTPDPNATPAFDAIMVPDLTGLWRLDRAASDAPPPGGRGPGGPGGPPPGSSMHRSGGPDTRMGGRGRRLPELIHITHGETSISIEDSTGSVVQEIATAEAPPQPVEGEMPVGHGVWKKDGALVVTRTGPRGTVTEQFTLEDQGATLVVWARMTGRDGGAREFKRVYRRQDS